ncbi:MAG: T9SS type A sorting domain-containing protein [Chitinophagaceae bacterium]|nr:T9SS type A sorting domain-containing protein [Chitinophagaceae bacterium]
MRKFSFFILGGILLNFASLAQVTVTNPSNTTPALAATYPSLANAITGLNNITAISGPVVITLNAGNPETAPPGGYAIQFSATTSTLNNITIAGNSNIITAYTPQPVGNLNDAVFKLIGVDHVQLQDFMMMENPSNVNSTPGTNDMTEFGVALLRAGSTDGAQNNTILNNIITLNKDYTNSFGVYSSVRHSSTDITADDITSISGSNFGNRIYGNSISEVNYGIVFIGSITPAFMDNSNDIGGSSAATGNTCTNWGTAVAGSSYPDLTGSNYCIYMIHGINENISYNIINSAVHTDINPLGGILKNFTIAQPTGVINATYNNNTINLAKSSTSGAVTGISIEGMSPALSTAAINVNNNLINSIDVSGAGSSSAITGISNSSASGVLNINNNTVRGCTSTGSTAGARFTGITNTGAVVNNININDNKLGDAIAGAISYSVFTNAPVYGIYNTQHPVTCSVSISNNDISGIVHSMGSASIQVYIGNIGSGQVGNLLIDGNTFTNLSVNTTSGIAFIAREGHMTATGTAQCSNNSIVGSFTNNYAGATPSTMYFYFTQQIPSQSVNGSVVTVTNNYFSNVLVKGPVSIIGFYDLEGVSTINGPAKTYTGNGITNITMSTGSIYAMYMNNSGRVVCSTNVVSNITTGGFIAGIWHGSTNGQGPDHVSNNTVSNLASGSANVVGIMAGSLGVPNLTVSGNVVSGLSSTGTTNVQLVGMEIIQGQTINIINNLIHNIEGSGTGASTFAYGMRVNTGTAVQVYQNKIYDVRHVGITAAAASSVIGIQSVNPANLTLYNNFIADLKAPNSAQADAIRGIHINALGANTTYKLYYNSIYLNAASSGTNFGTSGIFHTGNATATTGRLEMINNIIVNTATPNGTGITAAFRRSNTTLTNYAAASDHNLFYAGTPSANRLIFYDGTNSDQTLAAYQTRVSTRDANSISLMPTFTSATDLHLTPANCSLDNKGTPVAGITNDIDLDTRSTTVPDIGADEFDAYNTGVLAGIVSTAVCSNKAVVNTGTIYTDASCNLIAKVVPSGGDPVAGVINTCVTMDASQLYFNGDPYVQRHYDVEPVTSNQTTTSATITMYFTDAEFALYNTNNSATWPVLPTIASGGNASPFLGNVRVTQFHGTPTGGLPTSTPGNYTGTSVALLPVSVVLSGSIWEVTVNVAGFSGFYVHSNLWFVPLPITVNYLTGRKQGSNHLLDWKVTCVTTPSVTMTLERSGDARNFTGIYTITADAARCNAPFDHTDANPLKGMNYYRLKIMDADGKLTYSTTVALLQAVKGFDIISMAPNPVVTDHFKMNIASAQAGKMDISIFDMQGRLVNRQHIPVIAGYNSLPINAANLQAGTYTIQAMIADDRSKVIRFVKQ